MFMPGIFIATITLLQSMSHCLPVPGQGKIQSWEVNENCTRINLKMKSGLARHLRMPQYEFKNGDYFVISALAVGNQELLVTHEKGGFLVNDSGHILHEIGRSLPKQFIVDGSRVIPVKTLPGPFEEGPANRLVAKGWNGRTFSATYNAAPYNYLVLLDKKLKRTRAFLFTGNKIKSVKPNGDLGWLIELQRPSRGRQLKLDNQGRVSFTNSSTH